MADEKKGPKAKVERVYFHVSFYSAGIAKYEEGKHYPKTPETESQIAAGNAELRTVEMDEAEHKAEHEAAHAVYRTANRATLAAEDDVRKRGQLK